MACPLAAERFIELDVSLVLSGTQSTLHYPMATAARPAQAHSHSHADGSAGAKRKLYNPSQPERTLIYQTVAENFEILAWTRQYHTPKSIALNAYSTRAGGQND